MASLDIAALKAKLNTFKRTTGERTDALWKPTEGKHVIRIVPWVERPQNPFIELHFHYLGSKTYLSPLSYDRRDPIAEFADSILEEARGKGEQERKDAWAQAKPFRPKLRTYVPIIVRGEESKGVRLYSFGKTVYEELLGYIADPDYGDITDPKTGRDITLEYISKENSDTKFAKTSVKVKPKESPLSTDAGQVEVWLKTQPNIKDLYKEPSYAELKAALEKYLDPDNSIIEAPAEAAPAESASATIATATPAASTKKTMDAFDDLFDQD